MRFDDLTDGRLVRLFTDTRSQLQRHLLARSAAAAEAGDRRRDRIGTADDLAAHQRMVRERFLASIGGPIGEFEPRWVQVRGTIPCDGYRIDRIICSPAEGIHITGSLYVPNELSAPTGAVLYLCGHNPLGKGTPSFQRACRRLVVAGLVVFVLDPTGQGERSGYFQPQGGFYGVEPSVVEHDHSGSQCIPVGDGLARYFLRDAMCGVSLLAARPEVDPARIGVSGYSGGGTQSAMLMIADDRIAVAAPGVFIADRRSYLVSGGCQDAEQVWFGAAAWGFDHEDILLAMAPRPVLVLAARWDFFPIEGTRRSVDRASATLERIGLRDCIRLVEEDSEHACTDAMARAAAGFLARHLMAGGRMEDGDPGCLPPESLWSTSGGQVRAEFPDAKGIFDENLARLALMRSPAGVRSPAFASWLRERIGCGRSACPHGLRILARDGRLAGMRFELGFWWSQPGLANAGALFRDGTRDGDRLPVTVALWDGGTCRVMDHCEWLARECAAGRSVLVLDPSGSGSCAPNPVNPHPIDGFYGTIQWMNDGLMWLGDSLMAMRAYDVGRCLDALVEWPGVDSGQVRGYAVGRAGYAMLLAAALDRRWSQIAADGVPAMAAFVGELLYDSRAIRAFVMPGLLRFGDREELLDLIRKEERDDC